MTVFDNPSFDEHEHVSFFAEPAAGLRAIVAIHTTGAAGMAGGGCRMQPYSSTDKALSDALRLSRAMSYKLALVDMPAGGAKTVVIGDPAKDKSEALLLALGRAVHRLGGRYVIAEDVGTTPEDMRIIARETPYVMGRQSDTSPPTAYGVFLGLREAVRRRLGKDDLDGLKVAIQGVGQVGRRLARHLVEHGAALWISDVDEGAVRAVVAELGARAVSPDAVHRQPVDVFAPCALGAVLDDRTIAELSCAVVAGAANNQLAEDRHANLLAARDILFVPDFVLNAGGVIGAAHAGVEIGSANAGTAALARELERIPRMVGEVLARAERDRVTPHDAAVRIAREKLYAARC